MATSPAILQPMMKIRSVSPACWGWWSDCLPNNPRTTTNSTACMLGKWFASPRTKARKHCQFGCKVGIAATNRKGLFLAAKGHCHVNVLGVPFGRCGKGLRSAGGTLPDVKGRGSKFFVKGSPVEMTLMIEGVVSCGVD